MGLMMPLTKLKTKPAYSWRFEALGTSWEIATVSQLTDGIRAKVDRAVSDFDATYSRFRADSLIRRMAEASGVYSFPANAEVLFNFYDELWEMSKGKVSPLVGDRLSAAGYDASYSLRDTGLRPAALNYQEVIKRNGSNLSLTTPTQIDIGAIGKGYLVDVIVGLLEREGISDAVVDGSGDLRTIGAFNESIGLENPFNTDEIIGVVQLKNRALCASATNRRKWGEWHHIIDATTGNPTTEITATWVIADTAMVADGLATALFFVDPSELQKRYTYEYMRVFADGSAQYSDYFAKGVF